MVKRNKPVSQVSEEPSQEDLSRSHPLMRAATQSQELLDRALKRKDADDFKINELAQWKISVNAVASSESGRMLLKSMIQYSGVMTAPDIYSPNKMVTNTIKASFYLTWIRPYLKPELRKELE